MGDTKNEILGLREELKAAGVIKDAPEAEQRALRQAMRSPIVGIALAISLLGGGWAVDAPGAVSSFIGRAAHRAALTPEEFERSLEASAAYRAERKRGDDLSSQVSAMAKQLQEVAQQTKYLYDAELRRQGREDALRERHER